MTLRIISADQRLAEACGKTTMAVFGPSGSGKTWQLKTLPSKETLCVDLEAGMKSVQDWPGDSIPVRTFADAIDIACLIGGVNPAADEKTVFCESHYRHLAQTYPDLVHMIATKSIVFVDSITDLTRQAMVWAKTRTEAFSEKTGKPDTRGAYGLLARETIGLLKHLQHAPGKTVIFVGILEKIVDEFNRVSWQPQLEGGKAARELPGIVDEVITLIPGTPAESYLRARGLAVPQCDDLRFHPDLAHWETKAGWPALIGVVRDCKNEIVGLHRIYLSLDGAAKADIPHPKKMLGKVSGGAARLAAIRDDGRLGLCEGIETGLAVMTAATDLPVWATLSTSHLEQVVLPPEAREVIILADNDSSGPGLRAAETIARKLKAEGRKVAICQPPQADTDFNDLLVSDGPAAVADLVHAAFAGLAEREAEEPVMGRHLPFGFALPSPPLPSLRADEGDLSRAGNKAWTLLLASNRKPWLFRAGGVPSWIVPDDEGRPMAAPLGEERLRYMLARLAIWRRIGRSNEFVSAAPPTGLVKSLLATPDPALPVLAGIVATPVFGRNGALLTEPGYHAEAKLLYHPEPGFALPPMPARPTKEDIAEASALILDDLLGDFPFVSDAERAHAVALLLLGFVRAMIDGPTPLHLIEKPEAGTGAGLMIEIIATIVTGRPVSVMTASDNDEEWRKRITAKLRQMPAMAVIDNINSEIDSAALAAALTAPFWEDRILGVSEIVRIPIRCVWVATGNNPQFSREIARRIVRIRLDAKRDRPWLRSGFRHPDLMSWVRANRPRLVAACLLLGTAWIAAGKPPGAKSIGSFEAWSRIIGGILDVAGVDGFLGNLDELMAASDAEGAMWRGLVSAWWDRYGTAEVGVSDLYEVALACDPPLALGSGNDRSQRTRLGKALGRLRDRMFALAELSVRVVTAGTAQRAQRWRLVIKEEAGSDERSQRSPCSSGAGPDPVNVVNVGERAQNDV